MITQLLLLKWLSLWFIWRMNLRPDTWPGAALCPETPQPLETGAKSWVKWTSMWHWHLSRNTLLSSQNRENHVGRSCVLEAASVLQALEVGVFQDAVDVQVGRHVYWCGQFWGVSWADWAAGAHDTVAGAVPRRVVWSADAPLAVGQLNSRSRCEHCGPGCECFKSTLLPDDSTVPQSRRHPGQAQGTRDDLCSASWPAAPAGHSAPLRHCAAVSCFGRERKHNRQAAINCWTW